MFCFVCCSEFISIGWESPAGQTYASTSDLGKLMALMFSIDTSYNPKEGQVCMHTLTHTVIFLSQLQLVLSPRSHTQILDGETIREWTAPAYLYPDRTGFSFPWELIPLGNYTLRTKAGAINGYRAEFQMAVSV